MYSKRRVLVTGGAGCVGSALVPALLDAGYGVRVLDLFIYGTHVLDAVADHPGLERVKGDLRDRACVDAATADCTAVIHLACISNDPSFELNPALGKSINLDAFPGLVESARAAGVERFIYASSSSVYGIKDQPHVTEDDDPDPLTDYSRYKRDCETMLMEMCQDSDMISAILRPATICGFSPRLRLDLTVNILTIHALVNRRIRVFGGDQLRPNLNIKDMVRAYLLFLETPGDGIHCRPFNVGYENHPVAKIAEIVRGALRNDAIELCLEPSDDKRSYHINSDRVKRELGFTPSHTIEDAVVSLADAYAAGSVTDAMTNPMYYNIRRMQELNLS